MKNLILKSILWWFLFGLSSLIAIFIAVKAWNYSDLSEVNVTNTLSADKRNAMVESLFWKRDWTNDISFTAGNANVNTPITDTHIANKAYVDNNTWISWYEIITNTCTNSFDCTVSCPAGKKAISVGCFCWSTIALRKIQVEPWWTSGYCKLMSSCPSPDYIYVSAVCINE